jgi:hypothetical protein
MITSGKYGSLYKYLKERYADTVVLTFGQVEDLLGFALPAPARVDPVWWINRSEDTAEPSLFDAWILADRTATPNIMARNVVFERIR